MILVKHNELTNSTSPVPAPTSPFLSGPPGPPGLRLYADLSSPVLEASPDLGNAVGLGRAVSERVARFNVVGTISGGKCKNDLNYSIPSFVKYLKLIIN